MITLHQLGKAESGRENTENASDEKRNDLEDRLVPLSAVSANV